MRNTTLLALSVTVLLLSCTPTAETPVSAVDAPPIAPPSDISPAKAEILVLGDSQISFGAGAAYTGFFGNLGANCTGLPVSFQSADAAAIGVRSTSLHHWTARSGAPRGTICDVDPTYGVNAGAYGVTSRGRTYVQIGQDPAYPFCSAGRSPLEAVFETPRFAPDLVVLSFLGNATDRWQTAARARSDWRATASQLPADVPCVVMTTIPAFEAAENNRRQTAQTNLKAAVTASGQCSFVSGFTPRTRAAIQGKPDNFRTDANGSVTDPRHPTTTSAARFIDIQTPALCAALRDLLATE